jgi:hypothetical protein
VSKLWIDDATHPIAAQTLRMQHDDMRWLKAHQTGTHLAVRLTVYDQRCDIGRNTCPPNGPSILTNPSAGIDSRQQESDRSARRTAAERLRPGPSSGTSDL